ncbi:uncharacterized protein [Apostichopus japonicus]|uniref:uncharacterized protein n=1 Tax=Stichopus japonicus TaxID=307972 RepID=UPI003AB16277
MSTLKDVRKKLASLEEELRKTKEATDGRTSQVLVIPQERKVRVFSGVEGSLLVGDFIDDIKAATKLRKVKGAEAADFIMAHLEGPARQEIRHHPKDVSTNPQQILNTLSETFGEKLTLAGVLQEICNRLQKEDETITDFGFALMSLGDKLKKMAGGPDSDKTIKEQFRDGLLDGVLRREVKRCLMEEPNITFIKLRDRALDLADDDFVTRRRRQGRKINSYHTEVDSQILGALEGLTTALKGQTETLDDMKLRQDDFSARLLRLEEQSKTKPRPRTDKSQIECHRCHKKGHYANQCPAPAPVQRPAQGN